MITHFYVYCSFYFFLFVNKNKNCEYVVDNIIFKIDLHDYPLTIFETTFLCKLFICFFPVENKNKNSYYVVNILLLNWAHKITLWQSFKTHCYVNYLFCFFSRIQNKNSYYVLKILIFRIGLPDYLMTIFENTFLCKLFICLLFSRKEQQKVGICCWQYHIQNVLPD